MSKIINGLSSSIESLIKALSLTTQLVIIPMVFIISGIETRFDYLVLIAYLLTFGFYVVQWDRGKNVKSNEWQVNMAIFLVLTWSLIGNGSKYLPVFILLYTTFFIMSFYYWLYFFLKNYAHKSIANV